MLLTLAAALLVQEERAFTHESFDGFKIDAKLALPAGEVTRVIVLVHGSGMGSYDLDLTAVSKGGKTPILWFKDMSDALVKHGFAVVRYNKRNWQINELFKKAKAENRKPGDEEKAVAKRFSENALKHFVDDAKSFAEGARKQFPKAKIHFLGVSEGTHVALWAANELGWISGVALVGFYAKPLDTMMFMQGTYRDFHHFGRIDADKDGRLSKEELGKDAELGKALLPQLSGLDIDGDGALDESEFRSFLFVALSKMGEMDPGYRVQEERYPRMFEILKECRFKVAFFQGLWDNQTPAFHAMTARTLAKYVWNKDNMQFRFFPKLGHGLDPRDSMEDLWYRPADPAALKAVGEDLASFFE